jgi:hypothetical protein
MCDRLANRSMFVLQYMCTTLRNLSSVSCQPNQQVGKALGSTNQTLEDYFGYLLVLI